MIAFLDAECDDLLPYTSKIWCVSVLCNGVMTTYTDRDEFLEASKDWTALCGHNLLAYDLFVLWKLWNIPFSVGPDTFNGKPVEFVDTLVLSRYLNPDRGFHSLEDWGTHLGHPKLEHKDFSCYSETMRVYCENDVLLTEKVYHHLMKEMTNG